MRRIRPTVAALAALALAVAAGAASARPAAPRIVPAPPPASYCRVDPPAGWPTVPPDPALVPDLTPFQDYRSGLGITAGLSGSGVRIADVEYEWAAGHAELSPRGVPSASPSGLDSSYRARDHGTAVLGILGGADDGRGITGLASRAALQPVSPMYPEAAQTYQPVTAITTAAKGLTPGDVLLIELQALIVRDDGTTQLGPIEYYPTVRAAIAKAVADGIVVVEPAGNGGLDVGSLGQPWLSDHEDPLVTGALLVGAGGSGLGEPAVPDRERVPGSNWGARLDLQGYGAGVVTAGYADLSPGAGPERTYTACFDGTSSASATVAGAAAVLQSAAIARTGAPLSPARLRDLLVETGLPQVPTPSDENVGPQHIGPRPQIDDALAALASTPPPPSESGEVVIPSGPDPVPADGAVTPAPFTQGASVPSGTALPAGEPAAARGLSARYDRRARRLVIHLRSAAPAVVVRIGSRPVAVRNGRVVLTGIRPGRFVLWVSAPTHGGSTYRTVAFRITVPARAAVRVARI